MQLLEKITLYDLLGYTIPGSSLLVIVLGAWSNQITQEYMKDIDAIFGYVFLGVCIAGFLVGIALSEVSNLFFNSFEVDLGEFVLPTDISIIMALKNGKFLKENYEEPFQVQKYVRSMYGAIQMDEKYSRIHNYKAGELLNRNMVLVSVLGGIWIRWQYSWEWIYKFAVLGVAIIFAGAFYNRWKRMRQRAFGYTIIWFVEKWGKNNMV